MKNFATAVRHLVIAGIVLTVCGETLHLALIATGMTK